MIDSSKKLSRINNNNRPTSGNRDMIGHHPTNIIIIWLNILIKSTYGYLKSTIAIAIECDN